jgi:esterase/lipase superfamily enzyme
MASKKEKKRKKQKAVADDGAGTTTTPPDVGSPTTPRERTPEEPGTVRIFFATNRNPNRKNDPDDFGPDFNEVSVDSLRYGSAVCDVRGKEPKVTRVDVAPEKIVADPDKRKLGSSAVFDDLQHDMRCGVDTLVFVHGYNVTFREAIVSGALIRRNYARPLNVVVFSWPSDGSMMPLLAYKRDRTDAAVSGPAFARGLLRLRDFLASVRADSACRASIHLMAHSMGNYVLRNGIQEARRHGSLPRLFEHVFLMAADEDDDAFELDFKLEPLPRIGNTVNVYFNRGDTALVVSDYTKNNPTRLGSQGPRHPLNVPANVTIVDASEVCSGFVEHSYYYEETSVVADVDEVLAGTPHDRIGKRRYVASQNRYVLTS